MTRIVAASIVCLSVVAAGCRAEPSQGAARRATSSAPMGFIDTPREGNTIDPQVLVAGWAVDASGVESVRIFFDDELMATVPITVKRPDIDREYPKFASTGAEHGFMARIDAGAHTGPCVIRAVARTRAGREAQVYAVTVTIRE